LDEQLVRARYAEGLHPSPARRLSATIERHRDLYLNLVRTDLTVRYKTTTLGAMWFVLNPLLLTLILTIVFQYVVRLDIPNYPVFVLSALLPWSLFQEGLSNASTAITRSAALVKRSRVPRSLLVLAAIGASAAHFVVSLLILFGLMAVMGVPPTWYLLFLPVVMVLQLCTMTGLGLALAGLNVVYRDVEHVLTVLLRIGFYLTPTFYPLEFVPQGWRGLYLLNPFATIIEIHRRTVAMGAAAPAQIWITAAATSFVLLLVGGWIFRRLEPRFDDHV
jgi:ABC-type polysaccharide/polyol phosphate export permease